LLLLQLLLSSSGSLFGVLDADSAAVVDPAAAAATTTGRHPPSSFMSKDVIPVDEVLCMENRILLLLLLAQ
jgi:hypothetical protein